MSNRKNTSRRAKGRSNTKDDGDTRNQLTKRAGCFWNVNAVERNMKDHCDNHELVVLKEITAVKTDTEGEPVLDKNGKKVRVKTGRFTREVPMFSNTAQASETKMLEGLTEYVVTEFVETYPKSDELGNMVMDRDKLMSVISNDDGLCNFYNIKKYDSHADYSTPIDRKEISRYIRSLNGDIEFRKSALLFFKWLIAYAYQRTMKLAHTMLKCSKEKTLSARQLVHAVEFLFNDHIGNILTEKMIRTAKAVGKYHDDPIVDSDRMTKTKTKTRSRKSKQDDHSDTDDSDLGNDDSDLGNDDSGSDSGNDSGSGSDSDSDDGRHSRRNRNNNRKRRN